MKGNRYHMRNKPPKKIYKHRGRKKKEKEEKVKKIFVIKLKGICEKITIDLNNKNEISDVILEVLSQTDDQGLPQLDRIESIVISAFQDIMQPNFSVSDEQKLRSLYSDLIGEEKEHYNETFLYRAAIILKQPDLVKKVFKSGFDNDKFSKLTNFVFREIIQQFTSNEEHAKEIIRTILNYKKSIEPQNISEAIESNNIELLYIYLDYHDKCTKKSAEPSDIEKVIKSSNIEVLKFLFKLDKNLDTKIVRKNEKTKKSFFDVAVENSNIETIKYLLNELKKKDVLDNKVLKIAEERKKKEGALLSGTQIYNYLEKKLRIRNNQKNYEMNLFLLDCDTIRHIYDILIELRDIFNKKRFLSRNYFSKNQQPDDLLQPIEENDTDLYSEYEVLTKLKKVAVLIGILGTHEGGIQDKFNMIPWRTLKLLPEALVNVHKINEISELEAHKLLEGISADSYKLITRLEELFKTYSKDDFEKFRELKKTNESFQLNNIQNLTKSFNDCQVIISTLEDIKILEVLDFNKVQDRCCFIQCLQNIGEKYNNFFPRTQFYLTGFKVIKQIRNEIAHIWNKHQNAKKFLTVLETDNPQQCELKEFFKLWKTFIVSSYKEILHKIKDEYNELDFAQPKKLESSILGKIKPNKFEELLKDDKLTVSKDVDESIPSSHSLVDRQLNLIKYVISNIQKVIDNVICFNNYEQMQDTLKMPQIHYKFILILTIIGESIHTIKNEDDYLSIAEFSLLKELDFLKWVRNALMHIDNIDEKGTLIDYLSNDLLAEFSIAAHGKKIIEFSKYFKDVLNKLIENFQKELRILGSDNFFQKYQDQDQEYLDFDYGKKLSHVQKITNSLNSYKGWNSCDNEFDICDLIKIKEEIKEKGRELNINIEGVFGKLAILGFTEPEDLSGLLVTVNGDLSLDSVASFKLFLFNKLNYRLKVAEVRQLEEYLNYKIQEKQVENKSKLKSDCLKKLLQLARKYSLDNLHNNIKLISLLEEISTENEFIYRESDVSSLIEHRQISFDLSYPIRPTTTKHKSYYRPVLHQLCEMYYNYIKSRGNILRLISSILKKDANVNVIYFSNCFESTILLKLCYRYDESLFDVITNANNLDANLSDCAIDVSERKLPIEVALEEDNSQLIEFLKDKTCYKESLLTSATRVGNIEYIRYLINNYDVNVNIWDEEGNSIVNYAIFKRFRKRKLIIFNFDSCEDSSDSFFDSPEVKLKKLLNPVNNEKYKRVIELLLENNAQVSAFIKYNPSYLKYHPLMWSLKNNDVELSLLLVKNTVDLDTYFENTCPIHQAIENINKFPNQRDRYLELIKNIAKRSNSTLNAELNCGDTPLYMAAKQKDLDVMKILIDNGADVNYKVYRFTDIQEIENGKEVIEFFIDNGMRGACFSLDGYRKLFDLYRCNKIQELKQLVTEKSLNLKALDEDGKSLFWYAIEKKDKNLIEWLLDKGASLSLSTLYKCNLSDTFKKYYHHISKFADGDILQILNESGKIQWEEFGYSEISSICYTAFQHDDLEAIKQLEEHKYFDIVIETVKTGKIKKYLELYLTVFKHIEEGRKNKQIKEKIMKLKNKLVLLNGESLLHVAVQKNNFGIIEFLLSEKVSQLDKNILNSNESTALDLAVEQQRVLEVIKTLINKKVSISKNFPIDEYLHLNSKGKKSKQKYNIIFKYLKNNSDLKEVIFDKVYALQYLKNPNCIKLLIELDWDPNKYEKTIGMYGGGYTALHLCAENGFDDSIKVLYESGKLDFEQPSDNFVILTTTGLFTAVGFALENGKFDTAKLLIECGASPYKYLLILLFDALYKENIDYVNLLLERSVIVDLVETPIVLRMLRGKSIQIDIMLSEAIRFYNDNKGEINMPDDLYCSLEYEYWKLGFHNYNMVKRGHDNDLTPHKTPKRRRLGGYSDNFLNL